MALVERSVDVDGVEVVGTLEGWMHCEDHPNTKWCRHIEECVKAGVDQAFIWMPQNFPQDDRFELMVPVVPKLMAWARSALVYEPSLKAYGVIFGYDTPNGGIADTFGGYIHRGEGRLVLRSMFIDFFNGRYPGKTPECKSSSHNFQRERELRKILESGRENEFANKFYSVTRGTCVACEVAILRATSDPSLIPDVEITTVWSK